MALKMPLSVTQLFLFEGDSLNETLIIGSEITCMRMG
jgi:hypothetical protein